MRRKDNDFWDRSRIVISLSCVICLGVVGLLINLRPTRSVLEKRELARFPIPTIREAVSGDWQKKVSNWYVDSYPIRENMIAVQAKSEDFYGIRDRVLYGDTGEVAEEIPDADNVEKAPVIDLNSIDDTEEMSAKADAVNDINEVPTVDVQNANMVSDEGVNENVANDADIKVKPEAAGTIYVADKRGFSLYYFSKKNADTYASMINTVKQKVGDSVNMYDIIVPNSFGVNFDESVQESMNASNQGDAINYIYKRLDSSINAVETYKILRDNNSEYLYFNTDHHWTAKGAYYAYRSFCDKKGIVAHSLSDFKQKKFSGFVGSFYAYSKQSKAIGSNPDTVEAFVPMGTNSETITPKKGKSYGYKIISDGSKLGKSNKYLTFIGGDQPLIKIKNPKIDDGSTCVIIKESYGNAFVPFLVDHYQYVYVVDYRYYSGNATKLAQKHPNTDLIFLNNTEACVVSKAKMMLKVFK